MEQLAIIPPGAQPWQKSVTASYIGRSLDETTKLAYCSTLATYIFEIQQTSNSTTNIKQQQSNTSGNEMIRLCKIIAEYEFGNTIAIDWHPTDGSKLVLSTSKNRINFYNIPFNSASNNITAADQTDLNANGNIHASLKTSEPATWLGYSPQCPAVFAYQERKRTIRACHIPSSDDHARSESWPACSVSVEGDSITALQWHPQIPNLLLIGDSSGNFYAAKYSTGSGEKSKFTVSRQRLLLRMSGNAGGDGGKALPDELRCSLVDIKMDPNSQVYALLTFASGCVLLADMSAALQTEESNSNSPVTVSINSIYYPQTLGNNTSSSIKSTITDDCYTSTLQWIRSIPGGFLTTDRRSGVFHVWNVSQSQPQSTRRLLPSPIQLMAPILPAFVSSSCDSSGIQLADMFIVTFEDGSVGVLNIGTSRWLYLRYGGHTETIFSCDCLPMTSDSNLTLLATSSFDGTVKLWDIDSSTLNYSSGASSNNGNSSNSHNQKRVAVPNQMLNLNQYDITPSRLCCFNQIQVPCSVIPTAASNVSRDSHHESASVDISLIDTFPLMGYGRKGADGEMRTRNGLWYTVAWSFDGSYRLAAGSSTGIIMLYDARQARVTGEYRDYHKGQPVYRIVWNRYKRTAEHPLGNMLASSGGDGNCLIIDPDSNCKVFCRLPHPGEVFGAEWSHADSFLLSTGCMDGLVRLWDLAKQPAKCTILRGHSARVFTTSWSPLDSDLLASASDDCDVRVWSVSQQTTISRLQGHTKCVRGLAWSPEFRDILLSGSWDSDIRIWNVVSGTCLGVISAHVADVYGLSFLPNHPLLIFSTSRDNTFRLWSMETFIRTVKWKLLRLMCHGQMEDLLSYFCSPSSASHVTGVKQRFQGQHGKRLWRLLSDRTVSLVEKWKQLMHLLSPLNGTSELWNLITATCLSEQHQHSQKSEALVNQSLQIHPQNEALRLAELMAQGMESTQLLQSLQTGKIQLPLAALMQDQLKLAYSEGLQSLDLQSTASSQLPANTRSALQNFSESCQMRLLIGQFKRYCDSLCLLGQWERALALAPALGIEYWQSLLVRYNKRLLQTATTASAGTAQKLKGTVVPFLLAANDKQALVEYLVDTCGDLKSAYLLAAANDAGLFDQIKSIPLSVVDSRRASIVSSASQATALRALPEQMSSALDLNEPETGNTVMSTPSSTLSRAGRLPTIQRAASFPVSAPSVPTVMESNGDISVVNGTVPSNTIKPDKQLIPSVVNKAVNQLRGGSKQATPTNKQRAEEKNSYRSKMAACWLLAAGEKRAAVQCLLEDGVLDHAYAAAAVFGYEDVVKRIELELAQQSP